MPSRKFSMFDWEFRNTVNSWVRGGGVSWPQAAEAWPALTNQRCHSEDLEASWDLTSAQKLCRTLLILSSPKMVQLERSLQWILEGFALKQFSLCRFLCDSYSAVHFWTAVSHLWNQKQMEGAQCSADVPVTMCGSSVENVKVKDEKVSQVSSGRVK